VRLEWKDESWWLAGDADEIVEEKLLAMGEVEQSSMLKVGHHGSITSSTTPFLAVLRPSQAWISVGKENRYGHPSREVLNRLEISGTTVRRTDEEGLIR
jgi:competence protein ComEC